MAFLLCQTVLARRSTNSLPFDTFDDNPDDAAIRRTDLGADGPVDENAHALIDLQQVKLGFWLPTDPQADPFAGDFNTNGLFLRMDVSVAGVVNPPGKTQPGQFAPFAYGPNPVYGFIEVEMDRDWDTGGELANPEHRFLGNVVRFGGVPSANQFIDRPALSGAAFDGNFLTLPYVERSGEEFHLALLGSFFTASDITEMAGDGDMIFEADETWRIDAPWFHRAHGYEPFSLALGGTFAGEYMPSCTLQFAHDSVAGMTLISLVFPLTNEAAGLMVGAPPEPLNGNPSDQASILEALTDLRDSAIFLSVFPTGLPEEAIISGWLTKDPTRFTEPPRWDVTALVGTSYTAQLPEGEYFVWTDVFPDVVRGDMNANSKTDDDDRQMMQLYVASQDAADGLLDGRVVLPNFSLNFSVFDLDHSGVVDSVDMTLISELGDQDGDDDVDLCDWARVQNCFSGDGVPIDPSQCGTADLDADSDVDLLDSRRIEAVISGPSSS
ncbi:MAG: hypothetical protein ACE5GE_03985 [Phycisphaerae bacterium]